MDVARISARSGEVRYRHWPKTEKHKQLIVIGCTCIFMYAYPVTV